MEILKAVKKKILIITSDKWGCGQIRLIQPYSQLSKQHNNNPLSPFQFDLFVPNPQQGFPLQLIDQYDIIIFQRLIDENGLKLITYAKERKKTIIQEMDDNILHISSNNPFFHATRHINYRKCFRQSVLMSDYMHVTVPEISEAYQKEIGLKKSQYSVFPNAVDINHKQLQPTMSRRKELPLNKVIFGFQGGSSHRDDLNVLPPIFPILDEVPEAIFAFCSDIDSFNSKWSNIPLKYRNRVIFIQPETKDYNNFPNIPSMYDLGLVPLQDMVFNESKSHLKILEFGAWHLPSITSIIPDYQRFADLSDNAVTLIKKNKINKWQENIIKLLKNKDLRNELGERTHKTIIDNFTLDTINSNRLKWFETIL